MAALSAALYLTLSRKSEQGGISLGKMPPCGCGFTFYKLENRCSFRGSQAGQQLRLGLATRRREAASKSPAWAAAAKAATRAAAETSSAATETSSAAAEASSAAAEATGCCARCSGPIHLSRRCADSWIAARLLLHICERAVGELPLIVVVLLVVDKNRRLRARYGNTYDSCAAKG